MKIRLMTLLIEDVDDKDGEIFSRIIDQRQSVNPLSANPTKWSNNLKFFWVCLAILWGRRWKCSALFAINTTSGCSHHHNPPTSHELDLKSAHNLSLDLLNEAVSSDNH